ncbi:putative signal transducing protein [Marixanthomonas spongiae]|uniref:Uncharacterized protein n=1 Tax=Marixanthomonas spongiae TaxID=2174845 RepID=A0A2U0I0P9_9FLAO|nr:DUF2007 domain-containing protein [Marixanthomonas spongiae]PVW14682.1 hypothetical protein DDV96_09185 [Marixanthomonas spongiae]
MPNNPEETIRIYTGPALVAQALKSRLNDIGIEPITKDDHQSGIVSGFAIGVPGQVRLFIRKDQLPKAQPVIDLFLKDMAEEE